MICSLTNLKEQELDQIKSLETDLGKTLLAFSCFEAKPAVLEKEAVDKLQGLEKSLGMSLVAVDP